MKMLLLNLITAQS